ncbi:iron chaperone [Ornithinimicrobium tianjinense]|uniref:YdhG-like domain-containing protein n=1 Tax=Ornithinimicrobium tianjinense TaxID=1195761 RepID=A0A917BCD2_9MICO|nr:hypothetical protein [Ornithinimicrobium tianjinense]GGF37159.1 hypothetical protein GCM10011366_00850 [Ornithinimicrobium tianjinense]
MAAKDDGFSAGEKRAMRERAKELKAAQKKEELEQNLLDKIAEMPEAEGRIATRIHDIVRRVAPHLVAKTWYGMPAWSTPEGKVVVFFKPAGKFESRYSTLGFEDAARLDEGAMWPTSYALTELTAQDATLVEALVAKAAGSG